MYSWFGLLKDGELVSVIRWNVSRSLPTTFDFYFHLSGECLYEVVELEIMVKE